ncbi:MAG: 3'(2'),5'-bisphosphate nucleotidase CysQ [Halioglobus sp.]
MRDLTTLIPPLLALCQQAGQAISDHYHAPEAHQYQSKGDDSPLTHADLASHDILEAGLKRITPELPILSEESSEQDKAQRHGWPVFWMVDPLDGTKEFLARTGEFTINIALIDDHKPVLGVIYLPLTQQAYVGIPGQLARVYQGPDWTYSELLSRSLTEGEPMTVLASRRHRGPRLQSCLDWLAEHWGDSERDNSGSALKFCQLAAGNGDFYPRYSPCCEWDTAAGQALLEAAGAVLLGLDGNPLRYNDRDTLLSPDFLAIGDPAHPLWAQLLASNVGLPQ